MGRSVTIRGFHDDHFEKSANRTVTRKIISGDYSIDSSYELAVTGELKAVIKPDFTENHSDGLSYDSSNGRFTVSKKCRIKVELSASCSHDYNAATEIKFHLHKNGVDVGKMTLVGHIATGIQISASGSKIIDMDDGDYIQLYVDDYRTENLTFHILNLIITTV